MLELNFERETARRELARDEAMLQWADSVVEHGKSEQGKSEQGKSEQGKSEHSKSEHSDTNHEGEAVDTALIRFWKFDKPTVILGRSSKIDEEVDRAWCKERGIDVLRRCTGGASVVGGPGCLMYSVVVGVPANGGLRNIDAAHDYVMQRVHAAVRGQLPMAERSGICDLTWQGRKFSGNSLRVARHHLLYHGTLLLAADLDLIANCLAYAPRQPEYRRGRDHRDFICNVQLDEVKLMNALAAEFGVCGRSAKLENRIELIADELLLSRYNRHDWHERR